MSRALENAFACRRPLVWRAAAIPHVTSIDPLTYQRRSASAIHSRQSRAESVPARLSWPADTPTYLRITRNVPPLRHSPANFLKPRSETRGFLPKFSALRSRRARMDVYFSRLAESAISCLADPPDWSLMSVSLINESRI